MLVWGREEGVGVLVVVCGRKGWGGNEGRGGVMVGGGRKGVGGCMTSVLTTASR